MTREGFLAGVVGVCLTATAVHGSGTNGPDVARQEIFRTAVARLIATSGTTNAVPVRDAILKAGPTILPALREAARQTNGIPFETLCLLRALATELGDHLQGAVARGTAQEPSAKGLADGDIVVREDDTRVSSSDDMGLSRMLSESDFETDHTSHGNTNEAWRLSVKSPDGSDATVNVIFDKELAPRRTCPHCGGTIVTLDKRFPFRFVTFPDSVHAYWTRGALGPWDGLVAEALWEADIGQYAKSRDLMEEAFARGCRDPLAFTVWMEALSNSGSFDTIPFLCNSYGEQLAATTDSEALRTGRLAFIKSRSQLLVGQTDLALRIVDENMDAARSSGLTNSVALLTAWRVTLGMVADPAAYLSYARTHAVDVKQYVDPRTPGGAMVARRAVERYMAMGRHDMAHEFLSLLDPEFSRSITVDTEAQRKLAEQYSNELVRTFWMPVKVSLGSYTEETPPGHYRMHSVPDVSVRGPFRLDWTMCLSKILPAAHRHWSAETRAIVQGEKYEFSVGLDHVGRLRVSLHVDDDLLHATMGSPKQRHRFSLQVMPHAMRVEVDGQPHLVRYFADVVDPMVATNDAFAQEFAGFGAVVDSSMQRMTPRFQIVGCAGTIEDIIAYVPSKMEVDTDAMARTLIAMDRAIKENNSRVVTQAWQALQVAFRPIAADNPLYKDVEKRMTVLAANTEQPWMSLPDATGGRVGSYVAEWKNDGEWFTASDTNLNSGAGTFFATLRVESMELRGVIDIPREASNATCFVHWNSLWKKDDNAFQITPGSGRFNFGVWQDPRLFLRNRPFQNTGKPIPFCIRSRGSDAALFVGQGDRPVAMATGLKNQGDTIMINFRNFPGMSCRIGYLRIRSIPMSKAMDAPAEMPELPEEDKEK